MAAGRGGGALVSWGQQLPRAVGALEVGWAELLAAPAAFLFGWEGTALCVWGQGREGQGRAGALDHSPPQWQL
jgi:hypothetical protein